MGKINSVTVLVIAVMQFVLGYLWYGPHLFGDIVTASGVHMVDFSKIDVTSLFLTLMSSYGLTYILDKFVTLTNTKDMLGGVTLGLSFGALALGLPSVMLLNLLGVGKDMLMVIFGHLVVLAMLVNLVLIKFKKA